MLGSNHSSLIPWRACERAGLTCLKSEITLYNYYHSESFVYTFDAEYNNGIHLHFNSWQFYSSSDELQITCRFNSANGYTSLQDIESFDKSHSSVKQILLTLTNLCDILQIILSNKEMPKAIYLMIIYRRLVWFKTLNTLSWQQCVQIKLWENRYARSQNASCNCWDSLKNMLSIDRHVCNFLVFLHLNLSMHWPVWPRTHFVGFRKTFSCHQIPVKMCESIDNAHMTNCWYV